MPVGICGTARLMAAKSGRSGTSSALRTGMGLVVSKARARNDNLDILAACYLCNKCMYTRVDWEGDKKAPAHQQPPHRCGRVRVRTLVIWGWTQTLAPIHYWLVRGPRQIKTIAHQIRLICRIEILKERNGTRTLQ